MEGRNPGDGYIVFRVKPQNCHFLALCVYKVVEAGPGGSLGRSVCVTEAFFFSLPPRKLLSRENNLSFMPL
jgi:hypothetical protein